MKPPSDYDLDYLRFSVFSSKDIKELSVSKIVTTFTFNSIGNGLAGGLYDPIMGPYSYDEGQCLTCNQLFSSCAGHQGHIELCKSVYNPVFIKTVYEILRISCLSCFRLQITDSIMEVLELQLKLINLGYLVEATELELLKCVSITSDETYSNAEKQFDKEKILTEYRRLLEKKDTDNRFYNTKNCEALRASIVNSTVKTQVAAKCIHCTNPLKKVKYAYKKMVMTITKAEMQSFYAENNEMTETELNKLKSTNKAILADECRNFLQEIFDHNSECCKLLFPIMEYCSKNLNHPVDVFFIDVVPVTPPSTRPANKLRNEVIEHPQTTTYKRILDANALLYAIILNMKKAGKADESIEQQQNESVAERSKIVFDTAQGATPYEKLYNAWQDLQTNVDLLFDGQQDRNKVGLGLKQQIEKKNGIIRMNMMGKRVNYACRTVITPDPYINVDEIGIPDVFARKLSYPVPVTQWNVTELRKMVLNGPNVHPGANLIRDEKGIVVKIPVDNAVKRESIAKMLLIDHERGIKIVYRHLMNGDVMLLNRQPSLHKNSIMAHKARILKGEKTFRLHYSNCKSYNADFDGDEMNAHLPQNELARSEGYNIVNVANQYVVPKDGTPLGGLIQDHVISGVRISMRGRFFNREDYQQLVYAGLGHVTADIKLLPPAILKPVRLWSGKQIFSTIIINTIPKNVARINVKSTTKISANAWQNAEKREWKAGGTPFKGLEMSEAQVVISNGELMIGVLDKKHYGATPYGLIHCMYELYGGNCSSQLLSAFAKLFTIFLQREGFTLGVHDILVVEEADKKRRKIVKKSRLIGNETVKTALAMPDLPDDNLGEQMEEAYNRDPKFRTILDRQYKTALDSYTNQINKTCLPAGLLCKFPENNLQLMVGSGAKGSTVNTMQISCLLGQIELEGKRPPLMISGKSLPSFATFETSPKSGGFIDGRFLTGIQPQDFFFHCMAGREGLIDTAVKTSRSGYLQRCLIKHLEGLNVNYDMTVRDSDNSVIQFLYGEDGMDITMAPFLKPQHLRFLDENSSVIANDELLEQLKNDEVIDEQILEHKKALKSWSKRNGSSLIRKRSSLFTEFSADTAGEISAKNLFKRNKTGRRKIDRLLEKNWRAASIDERNKYVKKTLKCPDPIINKFKPDNCFGSISEHLENLLTDYVKANPERKRKFSEVMCVKSLKSFAAPGEPVGLLAAQSIGEPSTQMTLNTFHFAGRGEMNVTLGIPRLREILMMASFNIKTPSMDIPFIKMDNLEQKAEKLRLKLNRTTLMDVLENINIKSYTTVRPARERIYTLRFNFLPREAYKDNFSVRPKQILKYVEKSFFKIMFKAITKSATQNYTVVDFDNGQENAKQKKGKDDDDEDIDRRETQDKNATTAADKGNDSSDDEDDNANDDGDATDMKRKQKNVDEMDYDEPDVDEERNDASDVEENEEQPANIADSSNDVAAEEAAANVLRDNLLAKFYKLDKESHLWCEITFNLPIKYKNVDLSMILRESARKAVISEVPKIKRAITYTQKDDLLLKTDGINIVEMFKYNDILDINRLYTNDIHAVAKTYGIEAAARVIVKEVQNVFKVYGITVDPRHLSLIADYMTFDGTFKPLSRRGMESSASPLQQMTFESSTTFLKKATVNALCENLESPSSRIMVGKPCKSGTGAFSLINDYNAGWLSKLMEA